MGMFTGYSPKIITVHANATTNSTKLAIARFRNKHSVIDTWIVAETALSTTTTAFTYFRILAGGTTGNVTTRALSKGGSNGGSWSAMTARQITTHYTFNAGTWAALRYSETGTVALGYWTVNMDAVEGVV